MQSEAAWAELLAAFKTVGFAEAAVDNIVVTLSAVLQLGTVHLDEAADGGCAPADAAAVERAARTLMVRPAALVEALTEQHLLVRGRGGAAAGRAAGWGPDAAPRRRRCAGRP